MFLLKCRAPFLPSPLVPGQLERLKLVLESRAHSTAAFPGSWTRRQTNTTGYTVWYVPPF